MHISTFKINNYRKFGEEDNVISFVESKSSNIDKNIVASSTTLVIGKNNSGKTTITKALELIISDSEKINGHDFNYNYINKVIDDCLSQEYTKLPKLSFELEVIFDNTQNDYTGSLGSFIDISSIVEDGPKKAKIFVEYIIKDSTIYHDKLKAIFDDVKCSEIDRSTLFRRYINLLSLLQFRRIVKNSSGRIVDKVSPKNIIDLRIISAAKNIHDKKLLTRSFNKIIKFMYESNQNDYDTILSLVDKNNDSLTIDIKAKHQSGVEKILEKILSDKKIGIDLRSDLTFDKLMTDLVTYEHKDGDYTVPEGQFGLGYASLVSILGEIIDYANQGFKVTKNSRIRLLCIEEPEVFMHPQMQINFVRHIQEALSAIFLLADKNIESIRTQLLVTTHSSHILNSIIHGSNSLDEINYIHLKNGNAANLVLQDNEICDSDNNEEIEHFKFIKKHIKHQVPELFFSDAIIFVEGITEERILSYYIESDDILRRKHISVFRIDGAHGKVYSKLISKLKIPTLIITDIDYKIPSLLDSKEQNSNDVFNGNTQPIKGKQILIIEESCTTTNATLKHFFRSDKVSTFNEFYVEDKLMVVFQKDKTSFIEDGIEHSYYATSFEEAFILENFDNTLVNEALESILTNNIQQILGSPKNHFNLAHKSNALQKMLSSKKSEFSNLILYFLTTKEAKKPVLPHYISEGLTWLTKTLANKEVDNVF